MIAVAVAVVAAVALAAAAWTVERRRAERCVAARLRERVIVTLKSGGAFSGVLFQHDPMTLVLVSAVEETDRLPVDGELLIRWSEVSFVQKP